MTKTYNAKLVPMEENSQISIHNNEVLLTDDIRGFYKDSYWKPQRLVITDETGKQVAEYPNSLEANFIDLSDIRRWIDEGCKESVELEVNYTNICESMKGGIYGFSPLLTNNNVKIVWGEQDKAQPIAGDWADGIDNMKRPCYQLFKHMAENHDLILLETELGDIMNVVSGMKPATDWDALRDKFFKEHTELKDGVPKICTMPMDIFNFFKNEINGK